MSNKKSHIWLWVIGWIFVFPIPVTVLMLRNNNFNKKIRLLIITVAWIIYLLFVFVGTSTKHNNSNNVQTVTDSSSSIAQNNESANLNSQSTEETSSNIGEITENVETVTSLNDDITESITENYDWLLEYQTDTCESTENVISDSEYAENIINSIVEKYNLVSDNKLSYIEDFAVQSKDSGHYRTEFRLTHFKNAVGRAYKLNGQSVDIIAAKNLIGRDTIRIYALCLSINQCTELIRYASPLIEDSISDEDINKAIDYVIEHGEASGYYYGKNLGITLFGDESKGYRLMITN